MPKSGRVITRYGTDKFVVAGGHRVHYVELGEGAPVMLVPGSIGTHRHYSSLAPLLARRRRVIALDYVGTGQSDKPRFGFGYSVHDQADVIAGMIKKLGLGRVSLIGSSYGGVVVFSLATRYPELVDKVVSLEGGVVRLERYPKNPIEGLLKYPVIGDMFIVLARCGLLDRMLLRLVAGKWLPGMNDQEKESALEQLHYFLKCTNRRAWKMVLASYRTRRDFREEAKSLRCEALYIHGARSAFTEVLVERNIEFFRTYLPRVRIVGFEDGVHNLANQKAKELADTILGFLQSEPLAP